MSIQGQGSRRRSWAPYVANVMVGNAVLAAGVDGPHLREMLWNAHNGSWVAFRNLGFQLLAFHALPTAVALALILSSRVLLRRWPSRVLLAVCSLVLPPSVVVLSTVAWDLPGGPVAAFGWGLFTLAFAWHLATPLVLVNAATLGRGIVRWRGIDREVIGPFDA